MEDAVKECSDRFDIAWKELEKLKWVISSEKIEQMSGEGWIIPEGEEHPIFKMMEKQERQYKAVKAKFVAANDGTLPIHTLQKLFVCKTLKNAKSFADWTLSHSFRPVLKLDKAPDVPHCTPIPSEDNNGAFELTADGNCRLSKEQTSCFPECYKRRNLQLEKVIEVERNRLQKEWLKIMKSYPEVPADFTQEKFAKYQLEVKRRDEEKEKAYHQYEEFSSKHKRPYSFTREEISNFFHVLRARDWRLLAGNVGDDIMEALELGYQQNHGHMISFDHELSSLLSDHIQEEITKAFSNPSSLSEEKRFGSIPAYYFDISLLSKGGDGFLQKIKDCLGGKYSDAIQNLKDGEGELITSAHCRFMLTEHLLAEHCCLHFAFELWINGKKVDECSFG